MAALGAVVMGKVYDTIDWAFAICNSDQKKMFMIITYFRQFILPPKRDLNTSLKNLIYSDVIGAG